MNGLLQVVLTFTPPNVVLSEHLREMTAPAAGMPPHFAFIPRVVELGSFDTQSGFRTMADTFFSDVQNNLLVVQCALSKACAAQIHHAKFMCLEARAAAAARGSLQKHVVFVVHLQKDDKERGVLHPFEFHSEREWSYTVVDSVEQPKRQSTAATLDMLRAGTSEHLFDGGAGLYLTATESGGGIDKLSMPAVILRSSLRRCISRLTYPGGCNVKRNMEMLETLMEQDEMFLGAVYERVRIAYAEDAASGLLGAGWQAKLGRGAIAAAGTFRLALFKRLESAITTGFTRLLAAMDRCGNVRLYQRLRAARFAGESRPSVQASGKLCRLWVAVLRDVELCKLARSLAASEYTYVDCRRPSYQDCRMLSFLFAKSRAPCNRTSLTAYFPPSLAGTACRAARTAASST